MALFEVRDVDRRFYDEKLRDFLPEKLFDIHAHVYAPHKKAVRDSRTVSWPKLVAGWNTPDDLLETARLMFPDQSYRALMFGSPTRTPTARLRRRRPVSRPCCWRIRR